MCDDQAGSTSIDSNDRPRTGSPGIILGTPVAPPKKERKKRVGPSPHLRAMVARGGPAKYIKEIKKSRESRLQREVDRLVLVSENDSGHRSEFSAPSSPTNKPSSKGQDTKDPAGGHQGGGAADETAQAAAAAQSREKVVREEERKEMEEEKAPVPANGPEDSRKVSIDNNSDDNYIYTDYDEDFESYTSNKINEEALKDDQKKGQRSGASSSIRTNDAVNNGNAADIRKPGGTSGKMETSVEHAGATADMSDLEDSLC